MGAAVIGVTPDIVDGESAASTAWEREDRVTIGGRTGGGFVGAEEMVGGAGGLILGGDLALFLAFGDGTCGLANPPKEPNDPDNLLEKLLRLL